jgi:hypothetical protein
LKAKPTHNDLLTEGYEAGLVIPDTHFDERNGEIVTVDHDAFNAVMLYAAAHSWNWWVQLGDLGDWNVLSSHNKNNLRAVEGQTIERSAAACRIGLDCIIENTGRFGRPEGVVISGNHDARLVAWSNAQPSLVGLLEFHTLLGLGERNIQYVDYWNNGEVWSRGEAHFGHGHYTGPTAPERHLKEFNMNFFFGHDHSVNLAPMKTYGKDTKISQTLGCLCEINPSWLRGKANKWQQAFGVFYVRKEDGMFNHYVPLIFDGQFMGPDGRFYDGRALGNRSKRAAALPRRIPKDY